MSVKRWSKSEEEKLLECDRLIQSYAGLHSQGGPTAQYDNNDKADEYMGEDSDVIVSLDMLGH